MNDLRTHQDGVIRSPRLRAALGAGETFWERVERLENQLARDMPLVLGNDFLAEVIFEVFADDKDELAEAGVDGVVDGIVHDGFAVRSETV